MNKREITGRITKDATINHLESGKKVINYSVACGEQWTDKDGQKHEKTEFIECSKFLKGDSSENVLEYLKKGTQVYVSGKPGYSIYESKEGETKVAQKILVNDLEIFFDRKKD